MSNFLKNFAVVIISVIMGAAHVQTANATQSVLMGRSADEGCARDSVLRQLRTGVSRELDRGVRSFEGDAVSQFTQNTVVTIENIVSRGDQKYTSESLFCSADYVFHNEFETASSRINYAVDGINSTDSEPIVFTVDASNAADVANRLISERYDRVNVVSQTDVESRAEVENQSASNDPSAVESKTEISESTAPPPNSEQVAHAPSNAKSPMSFHVVIGIILGIIVLFVGLAFIIVRMSEYSAQTYKYNLILNPVNILHVISFFIVVFYWNLESLGEKGVDGSIYYWSLGLFLLAMVINVIRTSILFGIVATFVQPLGLIFALLLYKFFTNLVRQVKHDTSPNAADYS